MELIKESERGEFVKRPKEAKKIVVVIVV